MLNEKFEDDFNDMIATKTNDSKFSNYHVIKNVLKLLIKQKPCYSEFDYLGKGASALVLKAKKNNSQLIALKIIEFDEDN